MRLISMSDFILEQQGKKLNSELCLLYIKYAKFLKQPLELWMFVPVDDVGNILIEPDKYNMSFYTHTNLSIQEEYQQAKDRLLFEGWLYIHEWRNGHLIARNKNGDYQFNISDYKNVEALNDYMNLTLTNNAIKQIGL